MFLAMPRPTSTGLRGTRSQGASGRGPPRTPQLYFQTRQPRPLLPDLDPSQPGRQHTGQRVRTWTAGAWSERESQTLERGHGSTHWLQDPAWGRGTQWQAAH